jgi:hypothetical protein
MLATILLGCNGLPLANSDGGSGDAVPSLPVVCPAGQVPPCGTVGSLCDILTDAGPKQGVYDTEALECTSRICIKPIDQTGVADTWPFCSAECSTDRDCVGRKRNTSDPSDKACVSGFTCGVAFVKGRICCMKLCLCMDFSGGPVSTPAACYLDAGQSCL